MCNSSTLVNVRSHFELCQAVCLAQVKVTWKVCNSLLADKFLTKYQMGNYDLQYIFGSISEMFYMGTLWPFGYVKQYQLRKCNMDKNLFILEFENKSLVNNNPWPYSRFFNRSRSTISFLKYCEWNTKSDLTDVTFRLKKPL